MLFRWPRATSPLSSCASEYMYVFDVLPTYALRKQVSRKHHYPLTIPHTHTHTCSNGIGRTGVFITLHAQLERLKIEGVVDVFQFIKFARKQREGLISCPVSLQIVIAMVRHQM